MCLMSIGLTRGPPTYGAAIPDIREQKEQEPSPTFRTSVGKSSDVYTYIQENPMVAAALPRSIIPVTLLGDAVRQ